MSEYMNNILAQLAGQAANEPQTGSNDFGSILSQLIFGPRQPRPYFYRPDLDMPLRFFNPTLRAGDEALLNHLSDKAAQYRGQR
jgi:hypothetical protein